MKTKTRIPRNQSANYIVKCLNLPINTLSTFSHMTNVKKTINSNYIVVIIYTYLLFEIKAKNASYTYAENLVII